MYFANFILFWKIICCSKWAIFHLSNIYTKNDRTLNVTVRRRLKATRLTLTLRIHKNSNNRAHIHENPSMHAIAKILRARASEHSCNFCEQFQQRPNFASTLKLKGTIRYLLITKNWVMYLFTLNYLVQWDMIICFHIGQTYTSNVYKLS